MVHIPAGTTRLRFEGVADGIQPASAIVSGLPEGVIEKNRDARLLSPSSLVDAALGKPVELQRANRKTGAIEHIAGTLLSDAEGGVVFQTADGVEALRCSGLPETFSFNPPTDLSARPTLSVLVKSATALTREVTLSYLSTDFDWAASYMAILSRDGKTMDLGAWVTLANANGAGFPRARTQVVAGKLNREDDEVEPISLGGPILAQCWPRGSTSDRDRGVVMRRERESYDAARMAPMASAVGKPENLIVTAQRVTEEQLGDLKLYRVPERTTVAARQSKQVRLMDRRKIPVRVIYQFSVATDGEALVGAADGGEPQAEPAQRLLRTRNTAANHLGLPLPSGSVDVYRPSADGPLLEHRAALKDLAVEEEVEIAMGATADVEVRTYVEGVRGRGAARSLNAITRCRVEITNALPRQIDFELRFDLAEGVRLTHADHDLGRKDGRPLFHFKIPAQGSVTVRYETQKI